MSEESKSTAPLPLLRVAVISDTHCYVPYELLEQIKDADEIWHLGDVSSPKALAQISQLGIPIEVVQGNTDPYGSYSERLTLTRHGTRFRLQHYPPTSLEPDCDVFLHGHLHRPSDDKSNIPRILSPGAINGPRGGSASGFAWLSFFGEKSYSWNRVTL